MWACHQVTLGFNVLCRVMNNAYPAQASPMDILLFSNHLDGVFFNLGDAATVIIFVPIVEMLTVPGVGVGGTDFNEYLAMLLLNFVNASDSHRGGWRWLVLLAVSFLTQYIRHSPLVLCTVTVH